MERYIRVILFMRLIITQAVYTAIPRVLTEGRITLNFIVQASF